MNTKLLVPALGVVLALFAKLFRTDAPRAYAFDASFPDDGSAWRFEVVHDKDATALTELEGRLLEKLEMDPMFRCGNGLFGVAWIGRGYWYGLTHGPRELYRTFLLRMYKLVLEEHAPPDPHKFVIRHRILGMKTSRHDEFACVKPRKGKVCAEWSSTGYVPEKATEFLTKGKTTNPYYKQRIELIPKSNEVSKKCPIVKESWWCLWLFCPVA